MPAFHIGGASRPYPRSLLFVIYPKLICDSSAIHRGVFCLLQQDTVAASEVVPLTT